MLLQFSPLAFAQSPACALLVLGWGTARRPSGCCQLLARAWVPVADVRGRLLRGAWVAGVRGHPVAGVRLHFGRWATAREDLRVLPAFANASGRTGQLHLQHACAPTSFGMKPGAPLARMQLENANAALPTLAVPISRLVSGRCKQLSGAGDR